MNLKIRSARTLSVVMPNWFSVAGIFRRCPRIRRYHCKPT
jgi:hypothetical protein